MDSTAAKETLLSLRTELLERVERTHHHLHERDTPVSANYAEQSVEMENQELVMNLDAEGRSEINEINAALKRIDDGTYGICQNCGYEINPDRLDAIPQAALCIKCAS